MNKLISSESVYWCEGDDRYVRVFKLGDIVSGLNYMQGDDYGLFNAEEFGGLDAANGYSGIDQDLTDFYNSIAHYLNGDTEIERINQAIWAHFDYKND